VHKEPILAQISAQLAIYLRVPHLKPQIASRKTKPQNEAAKVLYIAIYCLRPANTPAKFYTSPPIIPFEPKIGAKMEKFMRIVVVTASRSFTFTARWTSMSSAK